ncbi:cupin domain-containing protein [Pedobacter heparinus]|uniref:cupin domain-containing protein n=1 Tax=Pedobacter heparinus TaxID=984 RepID=UPI00293114CB|nr:cupin domain-containing protein [Pedobacter heparinus]
MEPLTKIDLHQFSESITGAYANIPLSLVNDHVIRLSVMTQPYFWHYHPDSDETFLVLEGLLTIELENEIIELGPGQLYTVPANVLHRTRPNGARSVNLSFEREAMQTLQKA